MKDDKIDKMIYNYYSNIRVPEKINNISKKMPTTSIYRKNKIIWKISTVCAIFLMICTVTFGKDLYLYILNSFAKTHEGIITAINNDYYADINMEYINSDKTQLKVDYILMDDFNLVLAFNIKSDINTNIDKLKFNDMIITDENNNLIFCDDIDTYEKYCKKTNKEITTIPKSSFSDNGYGIETIEKNKNEIKILYKLYSSQFPTSKELNIEIHTIELITDKGNVQKSGTWKIHIDLPKEFYDREYSYYHVKDKANQQFDINIENVVVSNTQTIVKYNGKTKGYDKSIEGIEEKFNNLLNDEGTIFDEIWIEDENGKKFKMSAINDGYGTKFSADGTFEGELPFSLTKYDLTKILYLVIEKDNKEYRIELEN